MTVAKKLYLHSRNVILHDVVVGPPKPFDILSEKNTLLIGVCSVGSWSADESGFNFNNVLCSPVGLGFNPKQIVVIFIFYELCLYAFFVCPVEKLPKNINI
jgi:hypothetical protein